MRNAVDQLERAMLLALPADPLPTTVPLVRRDVMKPREYAEYMRVNVRKVHGWIHDGMPHFLVEGRIRIRVADADGWLEAKAVSAAHTEQRSKPEKKPQRKAEKKPAKRKTVRTRKPKTEADKPKAPRSKPKTKRSRA